MPVTWRWTTTRCGAIRTGSRPASWPGLLAAFLAGAPLLTVAAGGWAHAGDLREQQAERSWHQVPAVLLQAAPSQAAFRHWSSVTDRVRALAFLAVLVLGLARAARRLLDRRRLAAWEAA